MDTARWVLVLASLSVLGSGSPAAGKVGDPVAAFTSGPLIHQLQLTPAGQQTLQGAYAGRVLYRYISDDRAITVDLVVRAGVIEEQVMYLPLEMRRGAQVSFFLQDALGSVVGAQRGLLAFRAAVNNQSSTFFPWGVYTVRFVPMERGLLQVRVTR